MQTCLVFGMSPVTNEALGLWMYSVVQWLLSISTYVWNTVHVQNMAIGSLKLWQASVTQDYKKIHPVTVHEDPEVE
jgi:hypothetical protein